VYLHPPSFPTRRSSDLEERDLREQDAEGTRDEQLIPALTQQDEARDAAAESRDDEGADEGVEPRRAPEQPGLADDAGHIRERVRERREILGPGVGLSNGSEL